MQIHLEIIVFSGNSVSLSGSPSGGSWSGPGESGNVFYPSIAGVGTHTLTYTYTNSNGCSGTDNTTVTVNSAPEANYYNYNFFNLSLQEVISV